jgi:predicted RNA-binding Zn-ribbon protein involved in translation (DUF1610 family)
MFGDYSQDLLRAGIIELKSGDRASARRYLDRCVYMSTDHDVMAEAWYWLSQTTDNPHEQRQALENCLANDLHHARAHRALAVLDGRLKADEIIDPDASVPPAGLQDARALRFTCARCGGRMVYAPDGHSLVCEYCRNHERVSPDAPSSSENDFILAMATRRGHSRPLREQVRRCQACGAEFIRPASELSFSCPYCDSPHVIAIDSSGDLMAPDGILPYSFDEPRAADILEAWIGEQKLDSGLPALRPRGLYLPLWTFTLGGGIDYVGETTDPDDSLSGRPPKKVQVRDRYPAMLTLSVGASRRPSAAFVRLIPGFDLGALRSYDPRYLAAWPAELYDVPLAEASLEARSQAYINLQHELPSRLATTHLLSTSSANLMIESFRLDLVPVWTCETQVGSHRLIVLVNGQTGAVAGEGLHPLPRAKGGLLEWLGDLLNE